MTAATPDPIRTVGPSPVLGWVRGYQRRWLRADLTTGVLIVAIAVPLSMGMAEVAGMPPTAGLYTCVLPLVAYACLGSSPQLVLGLDASTAAMLAAAVGPLAGGDPARYAALAGMVAVLAGVVLLLAGFVRLGILAELLSQPVLLGFQAGLAVTVIVSQLPRLLGIRVNADDPVPRAWELARHLDDTRIAAAIVGGAVIAVIVLQQRLAPRVPGVLVAVVAATVIVELAGLGDRVSVIGSIDSGLPSQAWPDVDLRDVLDLLAPAAAIALVAAGDTTATSRAFAVRNGYRVDANRDLVGLGAANVASGLSGGIAASASAARTAVAEHAGSHTPLASLSAAAILVAVLAFLTRPLENVPVAALAGVVIVAVSRIIDIAGLARLWRHRRSELLVAVATVVGVVAIGVLEGIAVAVVLSLLDVLRRAGRPHDAVIGRLADTGHFADVDIAPAALTEPGLVLFRFDAPLFHVNVERFRDRLLQTVADASQPVHWVVVDASPINDVDATAGDVLEALAEELRSTGVTLVMAEAAHPVRELLERYELGATIPQYATLDDAVAAYRSQRS